MPDNKEQEEVYDLFTIVSVDNDIISVGFMERETWMIAERIMNLDRDELEKMGYKQVVEKWRRLPSEEKGKEYKLDNVFVAAMRIKKKLIAATKRLNEGHLKEIRTRLKEIIDEEE
jgi:hypothetical protein